MSAEFAYAVADTCEWAILSMVDSNGEPYCVPLSIARDGQHIYFHSAMDGQKISALKTNNHVCIACVGDTHRMPDAFTTEYESAILRGNAFEVTDANEKTKALRLICQRHTPLNMSAFDAAIARSLARTAVWCVEIAEISGKRKKYDSEGKEMKFGRMEG